MADTSTVHRTQPPTGSENPDIDPCWPDFNPRLLPGGLAWKSLLIILLLGLLAGFF